MSQDWPSAHPHGPQPLPRTEDLPVVWEGYDRARVDAAFDAFYRHIAQLDSTMRALESVEVFRQQAGDLRADLRSIRAAGWAPYPRGYALAPERSLFGSLPAAVPRIALEVVFLIGVAAVVAAAEFSTAEIVAVMGAAVLITFLVELLAARDRRQRPPGPLAEPAAPPARVPAPAPVAARPVTKPVLAVPAEQPSEDGAGWAAFAERPGQDARTLMGALSAADAVEQAEPDTDLEPAATAPEPPADEPDEPAPERSMEESTEETPVAEQPEAVEEPALLPVAASEPEAGPASPAAEPEPLPLAAAEPEPAAPPKRRLFRRRDPDERREEPETQPPVEPKHVRVLPPTEAAVAEDTVAPWERGFDDTEERRA